MYPLVHLETPRRTVIDYGTRIVNPKSRVPLLSDFRVGPVDLVGDLMAIPNWACLLTGREVSRVERNPMCSNFGCPPFGTWINRILRSGNESPFRPKQFEHFVRRQTFVYSEIEDTFANFFLGEKPKFPEGGPGKSTKRMDKGVNSA
jgi:hypothetical protein